MYQKGIKYVKWRYTNVKYKTMKREIKFRVWHNKENRWIDLNGFDVNFKGCANEGAIYLVYEQGIIRPYPIEDVITEQYTGLKDKNGVEIYEGDIIDCDMSFNAGVLPHRGQIIYSVKFGAFATKNDAGETLLHNLILSSIEVIGNIHENPNLLK